MSEAKLTIEIKNSRPIEVSSIIDMFNGLNSEYNKFVSENENFKLKKETKLYLNDVRTGSQIYDFVDLIPLALPFVENTNSVFEFAKHLKNIFDFYVGKSEDQPQLDSNDLKNISKIIEPVAKDNSSQVLFTATYQTNHVHYYYNSLETNAIQNRISNELIALKEPDHSIHHKVLFYWWIAKGDVKSQSGDKGVIESLSNKALRVIYENDSLKEKMINVEDNPFHLAYIIDVKVETIEGKPAAYKIIDVHESFPKQIDNNEQAA
jgi:hypothetical protein